MKKYAKPFVPESSKILKDYIDKISPPMDFPIADIACGYGRNGAFLVKNIILYYVEIQIYPLLAT